MREKNRTVINVGTTSLIMIFAVLALVTFALLSYSSASAQWRMAEKMADRASEYYEAEKTAAETLERLDSRLEKSVQEKNTISEQEWKQLLEDLPKQGQGVEWQDCLLCWRIPVGEKQQLEVGLRLSREEKNVCWELVRWQLQTVNGGGLKQQTMELYGSGR